MTGSSNIAKSLAFIICLTFLINLIPINTFPSAVALYDPDNGTISGGVYDSKNMKPLNAQITGSVYAYAAGGFFSVSVSPGYYSLHASASGYYGSSKSVYVYKGQRASVSFYLTPMPGTNAGSIGGGVYDATTYAPITSATVQGSGLYISAYGGYFSKSNVDPGYYSLTASANGYYSSTKSVYVYENQKASVNFYLTPSGGGGAGGAGGTAQAPTITINQPQNGANVKGTLTISGTMTGVTSTSLIHVYLNNVYQGDIQGAQQWSIGPVDVSTWPAAQYSVSVQADNGQKSQMVTVTFNIGDAQTQQNQQQQQDQTGGSTGGDTGGGGQTQTKGEISGFVYVFGSAFKGIQGANVSIGSKTIVTDSVGSYTFADLNDGKYTLSASKPGYNTVWANVTITNGQTIIKDLYLEPTDGGGSTKTEDENRPKGSIMGKVYEFNTSSGISGASVSINGTEYNTITDDLGMYILTDVEIGTYNITVSKEGYIQNATQIEVKELQTTICDIYLKTVDNSRPVAFLSVQPLNASVGETVVFNASDSYDLGGGALKYMFDFGDGNTTAWTSNPVQTHQYEKEGLYYATLVVCNDFGLNNTNPIRILIVVGNQTSTLTPVLTVYPTTAKVGQEVYFDGYDSKSTGDAAIVGYLFYFGDGKSSDWTDSPQVSHVYESNGGYAAKLVIKDAGGTVSGESGEVSVTILKSNDPPVASFTVRRMNAAPGEKIFPVGATILFDASSSFDPNNDNLKYCFIYGDGKSSGWKDTPQALYTYTRSGTFPAGLIVRDDSDAQSYAPKKLTVTVTNIDAELGLAGGKTQVGDTVLANPGDTIFYTLNITNLGEYEDTMDITPILNETGNFTIQIIDPATMLPLADTNKNKIADTGIIESQECKEVFVKVAVPKDCPAGTASTTILKLSGASSTYSSTPTLSGFSTSGANQTKNITIRVATYPDFSIAEKDAVKLPSNKVGIGDKLKVYVNVTNIGSFVADNATSISAIVYDGSAVSGKEIGKKTAVVRTGGEKIVVDCVFDSPGTHFISVKILASPEVNETTTSNNIVANKEVAVVGTAAEPAIGTAELLWIAAIAALCVVILVNQYFLFWRQKADKEKQKSEQSRLTVYKKRN